MRKPPNPLRCLDDPEPEPPKSREGFASESPKDIEQFPAIIRDPDLLRYAPYHSRLRVNGEFLVHFRRYRPGAWRRFWTWALLGWTWEKVDSTDAGINASAGASRFHP